jgi:hypothetical protein
VLVTAEKADHFSDDRTCSKRFEYNRQLNYLQLLDYRVLDYRGLEANYRLRIPIMHPIQCAFALYREMN